MYPHQKRRIMRITHATEVTPGENPDGDGMSSSSSDESSGEHEARSGEEADGSSDDDNSTSDSADLERQLSNASTLSSLSEGEKRRARRRIKRQQHRLRDSSVREVLQLVSGGTHGIRGGGGVSGDSSKGGTGSSAAGLSRDSITTAATSAESDASSRTGSLYRCGLTSSPGGLAHSPASSPSFARRRISHYASPMRQWVLFGARPFDLAVIRPKSSAGCLWGRRRDLARVADRPETETTIAETLLR